MTTTIIGIDAEWQTQGDKNLVLSYQWYGIDGQLVWYTLSRTGRQSETTETPPMGQSHTSRSIQRQRLADRDSAG
jgi:hypothetical protein